MPPITPHRSLPPAATATAPAATAVAATVAVATTALAGALGRAELAELGASLLVPLRLERRDLRPIAAVTPVPVTPVPVTPVRTLGALRTRRATTAVAV